MVKHKPAKKELTTRERIMVMEVQLGNATLAETGLSNSQLVSYSAIELIHLISGENEQNPWALYSGQRVQAWDESDIMDLVATVLNKSALPSLFVARQQVDFYTDENIRGSWAIAVDVIKDTINSTDINRQPLSFSKTKAEYISLIIDGQQRLTSLAVAFKGSFNGKKLYINLDLVDCKDGVITFKSGAFHFCDYGNKKLTRNVVPMSAFVNFAGMTAEEIILELADLYDIGFSTEEEYLKIKSIAYAIKDAIHDEKLLDVKTIDNMTTAAMHWLFNKLNTSGVKCSDVDTVFSYLSSYDSELYERLVSEIGKYLVSYGVDSVIASREFALRILLVATDHKNAKMNTLVKDIKDDKCNLHKKIELHRKFINLLPQMFDKIDNSLKSNDVIRSSICSHLRNIDDERVSAIMSMFIFAAAEAAYKNKPLFNKTLSGNKLDEFLNVVSKQSQLIDLVATEKSARYVDIYKATYAMIYDDGLDTGRYHSLTFARAEEGYNFVKKSMLCNPLKNSAFEKKTTANADIANMVSGMTGYTQVGPGIDVEHMFPQSVAKSRLTFNGRLDNEESVGYDGLYEFVNRYYNSGLNKMLLQKELNRGIGDNGIKKKIRFVADEVPTGYDTILKEYGIANYDKSASEALEVINTPFMYFALFCKVVRSQEAHNARVCSHIGLPVADKLTQSDMLESFINQFLKEDDMYLFGTEIEKRLRNAVEEFGHIIG